MDVQKWISHFEGNHKNDQIDWEEKCDLSEEIREPLARSLAIFQLGESGSGSALFRFAKRLEGNPFFPNYEKALRAFIAEEHRHAETLKLMVQRLRGTLLEKQWSDSIFRHVRKLINLEFELQVLLTAELIAEAYYELLRRNVPDVAISKACARIVKDEVGHVGFHAAFFRQRKIIWRKPVQIFWVTSLIVLNEIAWRVVWMDHKACFQALKIEKSQFADLTRRARRSWLRRAGLSKRRGLSRLAIEKPV